MLKRLGPLLAALVMFAPLELWALRTAHDPSRANHDVAWLLYAGRVLLHGGTYGVHVVELNPPLVLYFSAAVVGVAEAVGVSPLALYNSGTLVLIAALAFGVARLASLAGARTMFAFALAAVTAAEFALWPGYDFGQRDHLIAILMLPHLLLVSGGRALRERVAMPTRVMLAAACAFAIALKPHYALAWLAVELVMADKSAGWARAWRELLRVENLAIVAAGALYAGALLPVLPAYLEVAQDAYEVYAGYGGPLVRLAHATRFLIGSVVLLAIIRPRGMLGRLAVGSAVFSLAGYGIMLLQGRGFPYHFLPCSLGALVSIAFTLGAFAHTQAILEAPARRTVWNALLGAATVFAFAFAILAPVATPAFEDPARRQLAAAIDDLAHGEPVLFFSGSVSPAFPVLLLTGNASASPYSCMWQIAGNYSFQERSARPFPYRPLAQLSAAERRLIDGVIAHMERERPRVLLFDHSQVQIGFGRTSFRFERYFSADPRFARLIEGYEAKGDIASFRLFLRKGG
jgi:hypothetical protein